MATFFQNSDLYYEYKIKINNVSYSQGDIIGIEFTMGEENWQVTKIFPSSDVEMVADGVYRIRFTQEETINFPVGRLPVQANVKFSSGNILPTNPVYADVKRNLSKKIWGA